MRLSMQRSIWWGGATHGVLKYCFSFVSTLPTILFFFTENGDGTSGTF